MPECPRPATARAASRWRRSADFDDPLYVTQPAERRRRPLRRRAGRHDRAGRPRAASRRPSSTSPTRSSAAASRGCSRSRSPPITPTDRPLLRRLHQHATATPGSSSTRAEDGAVDDSGARATLLAVDQPFPNHNGGLVLFGPDGKLYIGLGDGGGGGDPERNGLDLWTLLGKILRIDPAPDGSSPYTIPADNPFVDEPGARPEIYSYGLRNPWRFSFDRETEDSDDRRRRPGRRSRRSTSSAAARARAPTSAGPPSRATSASTRTRSARRCDPAGARRPPRRRQLLDHRRPGRPRPGPRPPSTAATSTATSASASCAASRRGPGRPAGDDVALGPLVERLASFGEGADGTVYAVSLSGPVYRLRPAR